MKSTSAEFEFLSTAGKGYRKSLASMHEFYLSGYLEEPSEYIEWFDTIRNAGESDIVKIYINSRGGDVDTALQFMRVLGETEATVICSVEGSCMSAATMIFLCADVFEITPFSLFMFHNYSGGIFGKGGEIYDQAVFERTWSRSFLSHIYQNFLTPQEIESLLANRDIWLDSEEVEQRCLKLMKARQMEYEEDTTESNAAGMAGDQS